LIVPIDFSDLAIDALHKAIDMAGDQGQVHAIHVLPEIGVVDPVAIYENITDESRIASIEKVIHERLADPKYSKLIVHVAIGDPGHEIAEYAKAQQADLIVISSHGYGFLKHLLLGSVAERVVRLAHCPVLVLRS
jgi:nucleotide-binding universal stress UspA family protein